MALKPPEVRRGATLVLLIALLAHSFISRAHDSIKLQIARITAELKDDPGNAR